MNDTAPAAEHDYVAHLRALSPAKRAEIAAQLSTTVRELAKAGIRDRHPNATPREVEVRLAVRLYGRNVAARVLGPLPPDLR